MNKNNDTLNTTLVFSPMRLLVSNVEFYAYHGVRSEERSLGGKYAVDVELVYDAADATASDNLAHALNYQQAVECVAAVVEHEPCKLIETVAARILHALMKSFPQLQTATVRLRKYSVPLGRPIEFVEVEQRAEVRIEN